MLLDLPAQLGNVLPAPRASRIVQLLQVALGLLALRGVGMGVGVLCCCKLPVCMP
jgi:hypothetical protein